MDVADAEAQMSYIKTEWKDRVVDNARTYTVQNNSDGTITLIPAPGTVTEEGTPVNAVNMNKIETELETLDKGQIKIYTTTSELAITSDSCIAYVDVTVPVYGTIMAAVPVIVERDWTSVAKSPISVGLQDKETQYKKRIILNSTAKFSSVKVKIYWFYI